ncbi:MAG: DNA alkylation repair protein [Methanocorpusculum sp.]|nr:DNA alkylation repair protein [Methanocorpusculum sp.]MDD4132461.1 DNA alkylation repair protein [Methanocorpusculum sp.]
MQLSDAKYRTFSSGLLPGTENIIGVRIPILRNLAKEIANGDWQTYLKEATDDSFEEIMLQGLVISYAKGNPEQIIPALRYFIPKIDNWSVCDSVAMGLKIAEKYPDTFWKFALQHIDSDREFFIRFGVVMLLSHYVDEKHIDSVLNILDKIPSEEHYVKMAVAWAVSVCYVKFPEKSHAYLLNCHLNDDTYNKSIQKIIESYRVDDEAKNILRNMRRK